MTGVWWGGREVSGCAWGPIASLEVCRTLDRELPDSNPTPES